MKYANYDSTGKIIGFYSKDIHKIIPEPSLEITDEQWQEIFSNQDLYSIVDGTLIFTPLTDDMIFKNLQNNKLNEIDSAFNNNLSTGNFQSVILNILVDCRRDATHNDVQNVQSLISFMSANNISEIDYKGYDSTAPATIEQLQSLLLEMQGWGLSQYQKKWSLEAQIKLTTTIDELNLIVW